MTDSRYKSGSMAPVHLQPRHKKASMALIRLQSKYKSGSMTSVIIKTKRHTLLTLPQYVLVIKPRQN